MKKFIEKALDILDDVWWWLKELKWLILMVSVLAVVIIVPMKYKPTPSVKRIFVESVKVLTTAGDTAIIYVDSRKIEILKK
jgi:hypothetical protein